MKIVFKFLFLALLPLMFVQGQKSVQLMTDVPTLIYSLPKTELCFDVEYERISRIPGEFYLYSQRYLATENVVQKEESFFRLKGVKVSTRSLSDPERTYTIAPLPMNAAKYMQVNEEGILKGINWTEKGKTIKKIEKRIIQDEHMVRMSGSDLLPLAEEYMQAGSEAKMAEGAAKQIYHIRESRLNILTGEMESLPQDGKALEMMLQGLDRAEKQLTELFIGKTTVQNFHQKLCLMPDSLLNKVVLFRFSSVQGMVDSEDLSGKPVYVSLTADSIQTIFPDPKMKLEALSYYTILPAKAELKVEGEGVSLQKNLEIPQLGEVVPLSLQLFKDNSVQVKVDEQTGRLLEIRR